MEFGASPLVVRVGVVGAANIAKKNARAIARSTRCALVAVASRDAAKARAWCASIGMDVECVEGYDALLARADVDAVYCPLPTKLHLDFVKKAAAAGKHVLIEKPVGVDAAEVRAIVAACRAAGVALLDGTMFVHHRRFEQVDRLFRDATWEPLRVVSTFAFHGGPEFLDGGDIRTNGNDPLGCLGDVGWYCIRIGLAAFGATRPVAAAATVRRWVCDGTVPADMDCEVVFGEAAGTDAVLSFHCSFFHHLRQTVEVSSAAGRIVRMDDFVIPRREEVCEYVIEDVPARPQLSHFDTVVSGVQTTVPVLDCCQEANMWDAFAGLVAQGPRRTTAYDDVMILTHEVMDALLASGRAGGARVGIPPA